MYSVPSCPKFHLCQILRNVTTSYVGMFLCTCMPTYMLFLFVDYREVRKVVGLNIEIHIGQLCRELQVHTHTLTHAHTHACTNAHTNLTIFQTF